MTAKTTFRFVVLVLALTLLTACSLSGEPEIVAEFGIPTAEPLPVAPPAMPDLEAGAAFYAENCVRCHGESGAGNGELVQSGALQNPPPNLQVAAIPREKTLAAYFQTVTQGNLEALMPPFDSHPEQTRWDVAAYVYLGHISQEQLTRGAELYDEQGEAVLSALGIDDPTAAAALSEISDATLADRISGSIEGLSSDDVDALLAHLRSLSVQGTPGFQAMPSLEEIAVNETEEPASPGEVTDEVTEAATEEATEQSEPQITATEEVSAPDEVAATEEVATADETGSLTVNGSIVNGTEGGTVPSEGEVTLHLFDPNESAFDETTLTSTINEDGSFTFDDVALVPNRIFWAAFTYGDVVFGSDFYTAEDVSDTTLDAVITLYETTTDPDVVRIRAGVMQVGFSSVGMEVAEVISFENTSDRQYLAEEQIDDVRRLSLQIPLPPGAAGIAVEAGMEGRFVIDPTGNMVVDTQPLRPGSTEVVLTYFIPYTDGAIIEQEIAYPLEGAFHLLVEANQVTVESDMFTGGEPVTLSGSEYQAYVAAVTLGAGDAIRFTLSGVPTSIASASGGTFGGGNSALLLILVVAGLGLLGVGTFLFLRQNRDDSKALNAAIDALVDEIATLDDQNEQGMLNHDYYQRKRQELKARLADLLQQQSDDAK